MKRSIVLMMLIALFLVPVLAESGYKMNLLASPYALQVSTSPTKGQDPVVSEYGIHLEMAAEKALEGDFHLELGEGVSWFRLPNRSDRYKAFTMFGGIAYEPSLGEKLSLRIHLAGGISFLEYKSHAAVPLIKAGIGAGVSVSQHLSTGFLLDMEMDLMKAYKNYRLLPMVAFSVK